MSISTSLRPITLYSFCPNTKMEFYWVDLIVFCSMIAISAFVGIYFGCIKRDSSVSGYFFGNKNMTVIPVTISLTATFISSITLLGMPSEVYTHGTQYLLVCFSFISGVLFCIHFTLPVFYKHQNISIYKYMEARYSNHVRVTTSMVYMLRVIAHIPTVVYGSSLALNQVTGIDVYLIAFVVTAICMFYTSVGGLKAVVWTDTIQSTAMIGSVLAVTIFGITKAGGTKIIFHSAMQGERIEFFNMDLDPTLRLSFWIQLFGVTFWFCSVIAISPSYFQRCISLPTLEKAKLSMVLFSLGCIIFTGLCGFIGLILYDEYKACDPMLSGSINRPDQILPFYVLSISSSLKGMFGLFMAGIVSAAMSTISSELNTLAGVFYVDIIQQIIPLRLKGKNSSTVMKALVVVFGLICVLLLTLIDKLGSLLEISTTFQGSASGILFGVFFLGLFFPWSNTKGALVGAVAGLLMMIWLVVGQIIVKNKGSLKYSTKPIAIDKCPFNVTTVLTPVIENISTDEFILYRLSIFYHPLICFTVVLLFGIMTSYLTGFTDPKKVNPDLLTPTVYHLIQKNINYNSVPINETQLNVINRKT